MYSFRFVADVALLRSVVLSVTSSTALESSLGNGVAAFADAVPGGSMGDAALGLAAGDGSEAWGAFATATGLAAGDGSEAWGAFATATGLAAGDGSEAWGAFATATGLAVGDGSEAWGAFATATGLAVGDGSEAWGATAGLGAGSETWGPLLKNIVCGVGTMGSEAAAFLFKGLGAGGAKPKAFKMLFFP